MRDLEVAHDRVPALVHHAEFTLVASPPDVRTEASAAMWRVPSDMADMTIFIEVERYSWRFVVCGGRTKDQDRQDRGAW
jgi:hypothetical protein